MDICICRTSSRRSRRSALSDARSAAAFRVASAASARSPRSFATSPTDNPPSVVVWTLQRWHNFVGTCPDNPSSSFMVTDSKGSLWSRLTRCRWDPLTVTSLTEATEHCGDPWISMPTCSVVTPNAHDRLEILRRASTIRRRLRSMTVPVPPHPRIERRHLARLEHQVLLICHITTVRLGAAGQRSTCRLGAAVITAD